MATASTTAAGPSLFDSLAGHLGGDVGDIQTVLQAWNVPPAVAAFVSKAVAAASGEAVSMQPGDAITLSGVLSPFLPGVALPASWSSVVFTALSFQADATDGSMSFSGAVKIDANALTNFPYNLTTFAISSTVSDGERQTMGSITGALTFASTDFTATYQLTPDGQSLDADWTAQPGATLPVSSIASALGLDLPSAVTDSVEQDLAFTQASFSLDLSAEVTLVTIEATCKHGDAFAVIYADEAFSFAVGLQLANVKLSDLPQLSIPFPLTLAAGAMIVATGQIFDFQVPNPSPGAAWAFDQYPLSLSAGVTIAALLDLSNETSGAGSHLKTLHASTDCLLLEAQLPSGKLVVDFGATTLFKSGFTVDFTLTISPASIQLNGDFTITAGNLNGLQVEVFLTVDDDSVDGDLKLDYPTGFNPPLPFLKGVWIYDFGGMIGLDFVNQEVTAGLLGKFQISATQPQITSSGVDSNFKNLNAIVPDASGTRQSANAPTLAEDEFAIVLGVNDDAGVVPIPDLNLLLLRLTEFSFKDLLTAMLGSDAPSVSWPVIGGLKAKDIDLYWCDTAPGGIVLPDGTKPNPGFQFQGAFDFWGFHVWSSLIVALDGGQNSTGCSGFFYMEPIEFLDSSSVDVFSVKGDPNDPPPAAVAAKMSAAKFRSGGAYLLFDTAGYPVANGALEFLKGSWAVKVFDWAETVDAEVNSNGFSFTVHNQLAGIFTSDLSCFLDKDWQNLSITCSGYLNGTLNLPVVVAIAIGEVPTGKGDGVTIDAAFTANLNVSVSGGDLSVKAGCTFTLAGDDQHPWSLPQVDIELSSLKDLPATLLKKIGEQSEQIFLDAIESSAKVIVKYIDKEWQDIVSDVDAAYHDIVNTIGVIFGIHKRKRPKAPWLTDGALVWAQGAQVTSDPNDPNYGPVTGIYVVQGLQRYWVPDTDTRSWLEDHGSTLFSDQDESQGYTPDYVITIPMPDPAAQFPSVKDGTLCYCLNDSGTGLTLMVSQKAGKPAYYEIQASGDDYFSALNDMGISRAALPLPCRRQDITRFDKSELDSFCQVTDGTHKQNFSDGIGRPIPEAAGPASDHDSKVKTYTITPSGYAGIPAD